MKKHIPNTLTLLNLVFGCLGIIEAIKGDLHAAEKYMWTGIVFDFLDGFVARLLKSTSIIGKQLDSFADLVTSGVLPGMMIYYLINENIDLNSKNEVYKYLHNTALIIPALAAVRLAKFNLDNSQTYHFKGMPTPACAILIATIITLKKMVIFKSFSFLFTNPWFLSIVSIISAILLVSNLKFLAFKFNGYKWSKNKIRYIFGFISFILLITLKKEGLIISLLLYILIAIIETFRNRNN